MAKTIIILTLLTLPMAPLVVFNEWFNHHPAASVALAVGSLFFIWLYLKVESRYHPRN